MTADTQLENRVLRLEQRLAALESRLEAVSASPMANVSDPSGTVSESTPKYPRVSRSSEYWLQRLGIGLLLFGLAFLFKYSIDQGWLTPAIRVLIGVVTGMGLIGGGWRLFSARPTFARTLVGGGIGCLYISLFSAFQLYHLLSFTAAFAAMCVVTLFGFGLSVRRFGAPISVIAAAGGYLTPFVLYTGHENLPGLMLYGSLIAAVGCAVYVYRPWRSLLSVTVIGAWAVVVVAYTSAGFRNDIPAFGAADVVQWGVVWLWFLFAALPIMSLKVRKDIDQIVVTLVLTTATIGMAITEHLWQLTDWQWTALWTGVAAVYAGLAYALYRSSQALAWAHGLAMAIVLSVALWHVVSRDVLLVAVSFEALAFLELGRRFQASLPEKVGHTVLAVVLYLLLIRLMENNPGMPVFFNAQAVSDLLVIAVAMVAVWRYARQSRGLYAIVVHVALLGWLYRELHGLENGQVFVSLAWGFYSAILFVVAFRMGNSALRKLAMATLLVVVVKLFVVDLDRVAAIWRVLASLGLGGMLLLLSYYLPQQLRAGQVAGEPSDDNERVEN